MGILLALLKLAARPERLLGWEPEAAGTSYACINATRSVA